MTTPPEPLAELFLEAVEFKDKLDELRERWREEPYKGINHMSSMIIGEIDGVQYCKETLAPLHEKLARLIEAVDQMCVSAEQSKALFCATNGLSGGSMTFNYGDVHDALADLKAEIEKVK